MNFFAKKKFLISESQELPVVNAVLNVDKELRLKRGDVELAIHFNTKEELVEGLADYEEIVKIVHEKLGVSFEQAKRVRKDLEGIIDVDNGIIVLVKVPNTQIGKICLSLYALGSTGGTTEEIAAISHVHDSTRIILNHKDYKKYFRKISRANYVLSDVGLSYVTTKIIPSLREDPNNASD